MTALQDWLPTTPWTPRTIRALVRAPLRLVLPSRPVEEAGRAPRLLRPGVERC
ncbi:hypothetical protein [Mycolicibacterium neworleansense]|uniref:Uncharacterized protein n=1 Tax=Mycolicibacterium neworleansense TaxID=146018 RepID=A0A0H5RLG8_9MYCO|nr:hypothetical protein [Mycolicibacterium neworleansense]MCV7360459.1 hypothetical protein [Mycolicibacterium neworleansense]CRZ14631.1 hypothetical protein BN2156_01481 [Mycolicibacterium neworleansense]